MLYIISSYIIHYVHLGIPKLHYTLLSNDVGAATPLMRVNVIWRVAGSPDGRIQVWEMGQNGKYFFYDL